MRLRDPFDKESILENYIDAEAGDGDVQDTDREIPKSIHAIYKAISELSQNGQEIATWQQLKLLHIYKDIT